MLIVLFTVAALAVLWWWATGLFPGNDDKRAATNLEAAKIATGIVLGAGGLFTLYMTARRQHSQELEHAATESDAAHRRITELYAKSVEQLGSDKAPVRFGGLYALERLAQHNEDQRPTVINVLSAYLRMPYELPGPAAELDQLDPHSEVTKRKVEEHRARVEEREVRLAAQRILTDHLEFADPHADNSISWGPYPLDLRSAVLIDLDLSGRRVGPARFDGATFIELTRFTKTCFTHNAVFVRARFTGITRFSNTHFVGDARFPSTRFASMSSFASARFEAVAEFHATEFRSDPSLGHAMFERPKRLNLMGVKVYFERQEPGTQWVSDDPPYPSGWTEVAEEFVDDDRWRVATLGRSGTNPEPVDEVQFNAD